MLCFSCHSLCPPSGLQSVLNKQENYYKVLWRERDNLFYCKGSYLPVCVPRLKPLSVYIYDFDIISRPLVGSNPASAPWLMDQRGMINNWSITWNYRNICCKFLQMWNNKTDENENKHRRSNAVFPTGTRDSGGRCGRTESLAQRRQKRERTRRLLRRKRVRWGRETESKHKVNSSEINGSVAKASQFHYN